MIKLDSFQKRLFENLDASRDVESKDYVIDVVQDMFRKYAEKFSGKSKLSLEELYTKFSNNILPGFADFMVNAEHSFGCISFPSISNYLSVKHGCWLNTIDFMNKYNEIYENTDGLELKLCFGFIVSNEDLEKVEKDISDNIAPVGLEVIPHGFMVVTADGETGVFDPTIGVNKKYHYFYKEVPTEIWKTFKYFYNGPKEWEVKDFASWTGTMIRDDLKTKSFFGLVSDTEYSSLGGEIVTNNSEDEEVVSDENNSEEDVNNTESSENENSSEENLENSNIENFENTNSTDNFTNNENFGNETNIDSNSEEANSTEDNFNLSNNEFGESVQESSEDDNVNKKDISQISSSELEQLIIDLSAASSLGANICSFLMNLDPSKDEDNEFYKAIFNYLPEEYKISTDLDNKFKTSLSDKIKTYINSIPRVKETDPLAGQSILYINNDESSDIQIDDKAIATFRPINSSKNKDGKLRAPTVIIEPFRMNTRDGLASDVMTVIKKDSTDYKYKDARGFPLYLMLLNDAPVEQGENGQYRINSYVSLVSTHSIYLHTGIWVGKKDWKKSIIDKLNSFTDEALEYNLQQNIQNNGEIKKSKKLSLLTVYTVKEYDNILENLQKSELLKEFTSEIREEGNNIGLFIKKGDENLADKISIFLLSDGFDKFSLHFKKDNGNLEYDEINISKTTVPLNELKFEKSISSNKIFYTVKNSTSNNSLLKYEDLLEDIKNEQETYKSLVVDDNGPHYKLVLSKDANLSNNLLSNLENLSKLELKPSDQYILPLNSYFDKYDESELNSNSSNITHLKSASEKELKRLSSYKTNVEWLYRENTEKPAEFDPKVYSELITYNPDDENERDEAKQKIQQATVDLLKHFIEEFNNFIAKEINPNAGSDDIKVPPFLRNYKPGLSSITVVGETSNKDNMAFSINTFPNNIISSITNTMENAKDKSVEILEKAFNKKEDYDLNNLDFSVNASLSNQILYFKFDENEQKFRFFWFKNCQNDCELDEKEYKKYFQPNKEMYSYCSENCTVNGTTYEKDKVYQITKDMKVIHSSDPKDAETEFQYFIKFENGLARYFIRRNTNKIDEFNSVDDLDEKDRNENEQDLNSIPENQPFFIITDKLNGEYQEVEYNGEKYKYGDVVTVNFDQLFPTLCKINPELSDDILDSYKSLQQAFKAGYSATQMQIIDMMQYCRSIKLFREEKFSIDKEENVYIPEGYKVVTEGDINNRTKTNQKEFQYIFGVNNLTNINKGSVDSIIHTLNRDFNNTAAIYATADFDSYNQHKTFLQSFPSQLKEIFENLDNIKNTLLLEKDKEPGVKALAKAIKPYLYNGAFELARKYFTWFGVPSAFGNKLFIQKVLNEFKDEGIKEYSSKLDEFIKIINDEYDDICFGVMTKIAKNNGTEIIKRYNHSRFMEDLLDEKDSEFVKKLFNIKNNVSMKTLEFLNRISENGTLYSKIQENTKNKLIKEYDYKKYLEVRKLGSSTFDILENYIWDRVEEEWDKLDDSIRKTVEKDKLLSRMSNYFYNLFQLSKKQEKDPDSPRIGFDRFDHIRASLNRKDNFSNAEKIVINVLLDYEQLQRDIKKSESERKKIETEKQELQRALLAQRAGLSYDIKIKNLSKSEQNDIIEYNNCVNNLQTQISTKSLTWGYGDIFKGVNAEIEKEFQFNLFKLLKHDTDLKFALQNIQHKSNPSVLVIEKFNGSWINVAISRILGYSPKMWCKEFNICLYLLMCSFQFAKDNEKELEQKAISKDFLSSMGIDSYELSESLFNSILKYAEILKAHKK